LLKFDAAGNFSDTISPLTPAGTKMSSRGFLLPLFLCGTLGGWGDT
jgi:hypothetical protein